ncbi:hypothetical protein [Corallococcus silvisoli]|uniref:hypothetical protein n=1 Tax=Corallococcus silvisoli TaxID=2697031 RepID=UPI00191C6AA0|nr:hypothetical protein [Corallococcus silvisoli]
MARAFFQLQGGRSPWGRWGGLRPLSGCLLGCVVALAPVEVLACPSCTARAPESPGGAGVLLLALMFVPFALVGLGLWAARRAAREERTPAPVEQEHP